MNRVCILASTRAVSAHGRPSGSRSSSWPSTSSASHPFTSGFVATTVENHQGHSRASSWVTANSRVFGSPTALNHNAFGVSGFASPIGSTTTRKSANHGSPFHCWIDDFRTPSFARWGAYHERRSSSAEYRPKLLGLIPRSYRFCSSRAREIIRPSFSGISDSAFTGSNHSMWPGRRADSSCNRQTEISHAGLLSVDRLPASATVVVMTNSSRRYFSRAAMVSA